MNRYALASIIALLFLLAATSLGLAQEADPGVEVQPSDEDLIAGALLYDRWYAVLGVTPGGDMPIWSRQSTNSRSGPETWRCVECHGWDYKGARGAYGSGSHFTGFPGLITLVAEMPVEEIIGHLQGEKDPAHDFSSHIDQANLEKLALFLKFALIDDDQYIDAVSLKAVGADLSMGESLYLGACAECHGADGRQIVFRTEGVDEYLGTVANRDPWRFLHRTRFGVAGTEMPVGHSLGWTTDDGRDVLAYAQTLPTGLEVEEYQAPVRPEATPEAAPGLLGGILTSLAVLFGGLGAALAFIAMFVVVGFLVVWAVRKRR
jgi:mono/diheme cytochrome c family protein